MTYTYYQGAVKERMSKLALLAIALLFGATAAIGVFAPVHAETNIIKVTQSDPQGWQEYSVRGNGLSSIDGIADSQGGTSSLQQSFSDSTGKTNFGVELDNFGAVDELQNLSFEWYRDSSSTAPDHLTPAVGVYVSDGDGNSWLLKWEGTYNGYPTSGPAAPTDEWTQEDLLSANYWRIPQLVDGVFVGFNGCNAPGNTYECFQFDRSLNDDWLEGFEIDGIEIGIGSGWNGSFLSYADLVTVNDTTYDFELDTVNPTTKDDCKKGGYADFGFSNQGLCIQFVNTGRDSR